jgi:hypothetical protein
MPVSRLARGIKAARSSTPILCQVLEDGRIIARTATGSVLGRRTVELGGAYMPVQPDLRVLRLLHLVAAPRPGGGADRDARRHGCLVTSPGTRGAPRCACLTAVQASEQFVASIVEELRLARQSDPTAYHWHAVQQVDLCSTRCRSTDPSTVRADPPPAGLDWEPRPAIPGVPVRRNRRGWSTRLRLPSRSKSTE